MAANVNSAIRPGLAGLSEPCELIDEPLHRHEKRVARAYFGSAREICAILPRGSSKTTLASKIALHHLLSVPGAMVTLGAASRDQARIAFERMRGFAQHPALDGLLTIRHLELREEEGGGLLRVVPSDGPRVHGLSSTLYIGDEVWAWPPGGELLEAMQTGLIKRRDSKLLLISTAAAQLDSPLGRLRARALAQPTAKRTGSVVEAKGDLHWLEWSVPDDVDLDDLVEVKKANPAPWITVADLRRQRARRPRHSVRAVSRLPVGRR
jgi:phage terminase large subunit-like protein